MFFLPSLSSDAWNITEDSYIMLKNHLSVILNVFNILNWLTTCAKLIIRRINNDNKRKEDEKHNRKKTTHTRVFHSNKQ